MTNSLLCFIEWLLEIQENSTKCGIVDIIDTVIDYGYKIAMVVIALVNIYLVRQYHDKEDENDKKVKEKDRNILMLKTLILDHNLDDFYDIFRQIEEKSKVLENKDCNKKQLEEELQECFHQLFQKFINFLGAIDKNLFDSMEKACDNCRDTLMTNIADAGVNLNVKEKYNELILNVINQSKKEMLSCLFKYEG